MEVMRMVCAKRGFKIREYRERCALFVNNIFSLKLFMNPALLLTFLFLSTHFRLFVRKFLFHWLRTARPLKKLCIEVSAS